MNHPDFAMMLNADDVQLTVIGRSGPFFISSLEFSHVIAKMSADGQTILPFYYHKTIFDDNGSPIGMEDKPTICLLKVVEYELDEEELALSGRPVNRAMAESHIDEATGIQN